MNAAHFFRRSALRAGNRPALAIGRDILLDHRQLAQRAARLAGSLRFRFAPGERIAIAMANRPEYLEIMLACWWAGLAVVPMNARLHRDEFAFMFEHSQSRLAFTDSVHVDTLAPLVDRISHLTQVVVAGSNDYLGLLSGDEIAVSEVATDDLAWLFYTSGTTGRPKGAMITHGNLRAMTYAYFIDVDRISANDAILHAAPMSHGSGLYVLPHAAGGACQVVPRSGGFDAAEIFNTVGGHPGTTIFAAPTMVRRLTRHATTHAVNAANLKTIVYGGAPMYRADLEEAHRIFGFRLAQIYGQGESPMTITALDKAAHAAVDHPRYHERLGSAGTAQSVVEVRIADEGGNMVPAGTTGEILCLGASVVPGYWRDPEATRATMGDGWLRTGDLGHLDEDGFLTLKDRSKDLIISGGSNIYPREVEEVLLRHPAVREVAVIGLADPDCGERVIACVVSEADLSAGQLDRHCLGHIARFKRPKDYVFLEALPKNNYGKILKTVLRSRLGGVVSDQTADANEWEE